MGATKLMTAAGGGITLDAASTASDKTITVPARTGNMAVDGPAFSAYPNANQSISSGVFTLMPCNTEDFDTASCFNNTGSTVGGIPAYAFLPNVAGYYQVNWATSIASGTSITRFLGSLYKNGSELKRGADIVSSGYQSVGSVLIYLNGSSDYVQVYSYIAGTSVQINSGPIGTYFSASLVRAA